jgi:hypothetical protein
MTKADVIRDLIRKNPEAKPKAIIAIAKENHKDVKVSAQEVSTYRGQLRAAGELDGKPKKKSKKKRGRPKGKRASPTESFIRLEGITKLKEAVESLGGKENARKILEIL